MNLGLDYVPAWAYSWCYIFAVMGVLSLFKPLLALLFFKELGALGTIVIIADGVLQSATMFTIFWMCRSSLRGQRNMVV